MRVILWSTQYITYDVSVSFMCHALQKRTSVLPTTTTKHNSSVVLWQASTKHWLRISYFGEIRARVGKLLWTRTPSFLPFISFFLQQPFIRSHLLTYSFVRKHTSSHSRKTVSLHSVLKERGPPMHVNMRISKSLSKINVQVFRFCLRIYLLWHNHQIKHKLKE